MKLLKHRLLHQADSSTSVTVSSFFYLCGQSSFAASPQRGVSIYIMPIVHDVCRHHTCMPVILAQYIRALDLVPSLQIISANGSNISSLISPSLATESTNPGGLSKKIDRQPLQPGELPCPRVLVPSEHSLQAGWPFISCQPKIRQF